MFVSRIRCFAVCYKNLERAVGSALVHEQRKIGQIRHQHHGNTTVHKTAPFSSVVYAKKEKINLETATDIHDGDYTYPSGEIGSSLFWRTKMGTLHGLLDVNKDGVISYDDFKLLAGRFIELGHLSLEQQEEFHNIIKDLWIKQWGNIDPYNVVTTQQYLEDLKRVVNDTDRRDRVHQFLPYIFKAIDNDKDGIISMDEFQLFFKCVGLSPKDAALSFHHIDVNHDSVITFEEFVTLGRDFFFTEDESRPSKLFWGPLSKY